MSDAVFMLDTNVISDLIRNPVGPVQRKVENVGVHAICVSSIVASELRFGYHKRGSDRLERLVEGMLRLVTVLPYDDKASFHYADIRQAIQARGMVIGPNDLFIAAHARALELTLVTDNVREFSRVEGLKIENWLERTDHD